MKFKAWIVNCRGKYDTDVALQLCRLKDYGSSSKEAWKNFLALVGKDRQYWNKLDYLAEQVEIEIKFIREKE